MRPPGIAMQLDELEYFLPGLYPGVVLAIEGKLPFRGLEERLHDGVIARAALAGKRLDEPAILELPAKPARGILAAPIHVHHESFFRIFPVHSVVKGVDYQILVDAGGGHLPSDYLAREQVEVGGQAGPSFPRGHAGDVAAPHAVPLLDGEFPVQDIGPFVRGLPPLPCFLGPLQDASPFLVIMRRAVLPFATMPILRSSTTIRLDPHLRLSAQRMSSTNSSSVSRAICLDDLGRFRKAWYPPLPAPSAPHAFLTPIQCSPALENSSLDWLHFVRRFGEGLRNRPRKARQWRVPTIPGSSRRSSGGRSRSPASQASPGAS